ncbi:unnamed protein product [Linum trigynum]
MMATTEKPAASIEKAAAAVTVVLVTSPSLRVGSPLDNGAESKGEVAGPICLPRRLLSSARPEKDAEQVCRGSTPAARIARRVSWITANPDAATTNGILFRVRSDEEEELKTMTEKSALHRSGPVADEETKARAVIIGSSLPSRRGMGYSPTSGWPPCIRSGCSPPGKEVARRMEGSVFSPPATLSRPPEEGPVCLGRSAYQAASPYGPKLSIRPVFGGVEFVGRVQLGLS